MNARETRELLDHIASYEDRHVTWMAVFVWTQTANLGSWDLNTAKAAVDDFYARHILSPITWDSTDEPRPVLPVDINRYHRLAES
jgi:hypothetical protein